MITPIKKAKIWATERLFQVHPETLGRYWKINFWLLIPVLYHHCKRTKLPSACHATRKYKQWNHFQNSFWLTPPTLAARLSPVSVQGGIYQTEKAFRVCKRTQATCKRERKTRKTSGKNTRVHKDDNGSQEGPGLRFLGILFSLSAVHPSKQSRPPYLGASSSHTPNL